MKKAKGKGQDQQTVKNHTSPLDMTIRKSLGALARGRRLVGGNKHKFSDWSSGIRPLAAAEKHFLIQMRDGVKRFAFF